jgi:CubicO group peptidase (beta-lactamase class C family)
MIDASMPLPRRSRRIDRFVAVLSLLLAGACASTPAAPRPPLSSEEKTRLGAFASDLEGLRTFLGISGLQAAVVRDGALEWSREFGAASRDAVLPIGNLTEAFTAVVALRLEGRGMLRLDAPVADFDPSFTGPRTVLVRHLLSHTSEETPGTTFQHESGEFARLTRILESASGKTFADLLDEEVFRPANLVSTRATAGLSAATGLTSNASDLARFEAALNADRLLTPEPLRRMTSPTFTLNGFLPYGLGWFVTWSAGERMIWACGESSEASALFFRLPDHGLALILVAEGPGLSAPFRLSYGNPLRSSFVLSFLRRFVPLVPEARRLVPVDEAIDRALALQWKRDPGTAAAFRTALAGREPFMAADPALLAGLARVREADLLTAGETIGRQVQAGGWDNARTLLDLAVLNVNAQRPGQAAQILRGLLTRENVRSAPLLAEARRLLDEAEKASVP